MNAIKHRVRAGLLVIAAVLATITTTQGAGAAPFAAYVMDGRSGKALYEQNADTPLHPASLTKMMTLYLAFAAIEQGRVRLDSKFTVSSHAASMPPSKLGLRPGQQIELRYLIRAAAIKSANDAATVIGEGLAGSEPKFAAQMTATARALGMRNTQFRNANGLSADGHYSSAKDMTVLGRHLFYDFPQYYSLFSRRSADAGIAKVSSTNARFLDNYEGADGIKTGYTRAAGFNLTASAQRGSKRIMATVMGGTSTAQRNQVMMQLLDGGFSRSPVNVAVVRPKAVVVPVERVRRATVAVAAAPVQAPAPRARVATASASTAALATNTLDLSAALREAMASRPDPAPVRPAAASNRATAAAPAAAAAQDDGAVVASIRPMAKPEGSSADDTTLDEPEAQAPASPLAARPFRRGAASTFLEPAADGRRADTATADTPTGASAQAPDPRPESTRIVRRDTASGARDWGISLGLYTSKAEAEQLLLKAALRESDTLDSALRKVATTKRGYQANFVGMTREQARMACDKLAARSQQCSVVAPS